MRTPEEIRSELRQRGQYELASLHDAALLSFERCRIALGFLPHTAQGAPSPSPSHSGQICLACSRPLTHDQIVDGWDVHPACEEKGAEELDAKVRRARADSDP
jgi:hypothetical protein